MNSDYYNTISPIIEFNELYKYRDEYDLFSIIKIKYMKNIINIHEFILKEYFGNYEILKKDFIICDDFKELHFSCSIICDKYFLEFEYFELIIKYLYGFTCDLTNIKLNNLFKIHAFLDKHCVTKSNLIEMIENKINHIIYYMPIINIYGGKNNCSYELKYNAHERMNDNILNFLKSQTKFIINQYNKYIYEILLLNNNIKNLVDLFDKYDNYILDKKIYNYALSLVHNKYNLKDHINNILFNLDFSSHDFNDNTKIIMYTNFWNHKYYTLSFLNSKFRYINIKNVLRGYYRQYIDKNVFTEHVILKCAELNNIDEDNYDDLDDDNDDLDDDNDDEVIEFPKQVPVKKPKKRAFKKNSNLIVME